MRTCLGVFVRYAFRALHVRFCKFLLDILARIDVGTLDVADVPNLAMRALVGNVRVVREFARVRVRLSRMCCGYYMYDPFVL